MFRSFLAISIGASTRPIDVIGGSIAAVLLTGCTLAPHQVDAEQSISRSVDAAAAVVFRVEGGPIDANAASDGSLTTVSAIRRAIETSSEVQAALARVRAAQAEADLASLLPNPVLSFVLRFPEGGGKPDIEAGLGADLLALLQRPRRASIAGHRLEAEAARSLSTALDVVADVQARYADVQSLEELIPVLDNRVELLSRIREVAQARLELGEGKRHDVTALDSERMELSVEVAQRRRDLRVARLGLARAIGEPSSAADWRLEAWSAPPEISTSESAWIDVALAARPEVLAIEWELRAREEEEAIARGQAFGGATIGLDAERDGDWSVGPSISTPLPLFDTGRARAERARALTSEERHRLTEAQRGVVEDVRSALANSIGAQADHERVVRDLIPLQQQRRAEIEEAYRQGFVDVTALLFADQSLQQTEARRIELARSVSLAQSRLQRSVGGPLLFRETATSDTEKSQP